jgi:flagellar biosynthesis protein FlhG
LDDFVSDQAEGLRRLFSGPRCRVLTLLSASDREERDSVLMNLGASLARSGQDVVLVDACRKPCGISAGLGRGSAQTLLDVARNKCSLADAIHQAGQGFGYADTTRAGRLSAEDARRLEQTFVALTNGLDVVLVSTELNDKHNLPIDAFAAGDLIVQLSTRRKSIADAYGLIKHLSGTTGKRPFGVLVTGASEVEARAVYQNMAKAARKYLAVTLKCLGSVPADDCVARASGLGRPVVDAFPLAKASVAFRRLAEALAQPSKV